LHIFLISPIGLQLNRLLKIRIELPNLLAMLALRSKIGNSHRKNAAELWKAQCYRPNSTNSNPNSNNKNVNSLPTPEQVQLFFGIGKSAGDETLDKTEAVESQYKYPYWDQKHKLGQYHYFDMVSFF
jgi:hypothetical protein